MTKEARLRRFGIFSTLMIVCLLGWSSNLQAQWNTSGNNINNTNSGNVGVGNSSPGYLLDLARAGSTTTTNTYEPGNPLITVRNTSATNNNYGGIGFANSAASGFLTSAIYGVNESHTTTPSGNMQFWVKSAGTFAEAMRITAGGNIGIGTSSPSTKLHVNGDLTVSGNIAAKYQDIAEWVESSQELLSGTVVVLDSSKSNRVVASTRSYDTAVAGVISNQPGIVLGERSEHTVLVATTGRVKVRVSTKGGAIQIGDLLVTSDETGLAMKSQAVDIGGIRIHRPGTLIGKALEPLATGTGEILVLLSLQ